MNRSLAMSGAGLISLCCAAFYIPGAQAAETDPEGDRILKAMSEYLGKTKAFSMSAAIDLEVVMRDGQKLRRKRKQDSFANVDSVNIRGLMR